MELHPFDFRDPGRLLTQVAARVPLVQGVVYVVLVRRPSTEQRIVTVERLETPALIDDWYDAREEIRDVMRRLPIPDQPRPPQHSALTVVVRRGLCVFGPNEGRWMTAWRYSNHGANAYDGDLTLVTEHGWADFMTDTAGPSPATAA